MYRIQLYDQISSCFDLLLENLSSLSEFIVKNSYPTYISCGENRFTNDPNLAQKAILDLSRNENLAPQETTTYLGAIGCDYITLELISKINAQKIEIKRLTQIYKRDYSKNSTKAIRDILSPSQPDISLKHLYRNIITLNYHPSRIAWSRCKSYSCVKISKIEAEKMLDKIGAGEHLEIQREKLKLLDEKTVLIKRRKIKPSWVANVSSIAENSSKKQDKISTSLPIFYLHEEKYPDPIICFSKKNNRSKHSVRSDKKVGEFPYLKSINVYSYQEK